MSASDETNNETDASESRSNGTGRSAPSPRPACGERSTREARRVRGPLRESEPLRIVERPPHPDPLPASGARERAQREAIQCICIDPAHVARVWPLVAHLIRAAMRKGRISEFADVEAAVLAGTELLWVAADRQAIWAAAVTQLGRANGEKFCTIVACGGRERARWLPLKAELEKFARAEGCAAIRIHGRRGWAREFPDYRLTRILLEKELG
jgi:hypothetical protein